MSNHRSLNDALIELVNDKFGLKLKQGKVQKINFHAYNQTIVKRILRELKFKEIGNIYDFGDKLPIPEVVNGNEIFKNYDMFQRIAISKKNKCVLLYTMDYRYIFCSFIVDKKHVKKLSKKITPLLEDNSHNDLFRGVDFKCPKGTYIEVCAPIDNENNSIDTVRKKVPNENLVFDQGSTIYDVINDITSFFTSETKKLYEDMQIPYKRGIILYGDPGNGKSAMLRELIRRVDDVSKIILNSNINDNMMDVISSLIKSLDGRQAIVIIEDIDSVITKRNRSEFLNILDGIDMKSGILFIGTTNYPEQIDPAFMNRSGRFDRTYKIDNPSATVRELFFKSRNIDKLMTGYTVYKDGKRKVTDRSIIELFVQYSDDLPMATLKEIMTGAQYMLVNNKNISIEEALERTYSGLTNSKKTHSKSHQEYVNKKSVAMHEMSFALSKYGTYMHEGDLVRNNNGFIVIARKN